jgi:hypothetical protein
MNDVKWLLEQNVEYAKSYPGELKMDQMRSFGRKQPFRPFVGMCLSSNACPGNKTLKSSNY